MRNTVVNRLRLAGDLRTLNQGSILGFSMDRNNQQWCLASVIIRAYRDGGHI